MRVRFRRLRLAILPPLLALPLAGCEDRSASAPPLPPAAGAGPRAEALWTVTVREADSLYLSSPGDFWADPRDGSFYIADRFAGRVVQIDRQGRPLRLFGRKGKGPGEFTQVSTMFTRGDELFVDDGARRAFTVFDRRTGALKGVRPHEGIFYDVRLVGDTAWLGMQNLERGTAAARWEMQGDSIHYLAALPVEYRQSQPLAGIYNGSFVVPWADTLLVAVQASDALYLHNTRGDVLDTVPVPIGRRRGVPKDVVKQFQKMEFPRMFSAASALFALNRLSDGRIAMVHFDQQMDGGAITADAFVSVLSADRRRACVDGVLPLAKDAQPRLLFRGDTLLVLQQRLAAGDRAETTITAFRLTTAGCAWRPVESSGES